MGYSLQFGLVTALLLGVLVLVSIVVLNPFSRGKDGGISLGIHSAHIKLAQEAQSGNSQLTGTIPGLDGDKNIRYTVSLDTPDQINPNEDTTLSFRVFNARTGNPVGAFKEVYTKTSHLIIVNSALDYFSHIHPEQKDNGFVVTTQFPSSGVYHLYIDFQPYGGIEQQIGFSVTVCCGESAKPTQKPDTTLTKEFGSHLVTLNMHGALSAAKMTLGQQKISFTLSDAKTKKPITNLKPYLGTFGHLVMIREEDYSYMHVHPGNPMILPETATGGPTVDFLPIGFYGPFKEGTYRMFAQFNPGGTLILTDFTVQVGK